MKLKNKKTGEIGYLHSDSDNQVQVARNSGYNYKYYDSLAELNEEWEDYEEPKVYWHIFGTNITKTQEGLDEVYDKRNKEIGNYFGTKEEAEQAVEKLKAWKRLKDKGFKFAGWEDCNSEINTICFSFPEDKWELDTGEDLGLLFGGEDE